MPAPPPRRADRLFDPVSIAPLALFRVLFGGVNLVLVGLYAAHGMIDRYYIAPERHFTYPGFGWVAPWPGDGMYWHFGALAALSVLVAIGLFYRVAIVGLAIGLAHLFFIEQARYLNHYYLNVVVAALLACLPAHRAWSIDAWRRPDIRQTGMPRWALWLLRFQVSMPYVFGGIAKIDREWLDGLVLLRELHGRSSLPIVGPIMATDWISPFMSVGGLLLDLLVVPLLLWRRTRWFAFAFAASFHVTNSILFKIDIFPWFMLGATFLLFFDDLVPTVAGSAAAPAGRHRGWVTAALALFVVVQLALPLRHWVYPGTTNWTDHGHDFAWRMMMRAKSGWVRGMTATYTTPEGERRTSAIGVPTDEAFWAGHWQFRKMAQTPDMILQFCRWQADDLEQRGHTDVEIRADIVATLNGRRHVPLVDPAVNLAAQSRSPFDRSWIVPLTEPAPELDDLLARLAARR